MPAIEEFQGLRVLLVEDDMMICLLLEDMLAELGCKVVGPACDIRRATDLAQRHEGIDVAILDVHLAGQVVFPVADILAKRDVPFLFATGLGADGLPAEWQDRQTLQKPMSMAQLAVALGNTVRDRRS
ncbi:MAG TPA: response regulator [Xanthobacteraceae bacterium]|jgi:CheY-like chemotaxis protein